MGAAAPVITETVTRLTNKFLAGSVAALCLATTAAPQGQAQFRSTTELVPVDVIATDESGRPVSDLTPGDLVLKVDGKARPIQSLQLVQILSAARRESAPVAVRAAAAVPPPFTTNTEVKGRTFVFAIDHENIHPGNERTAIEAATTLVDRLAPEDRVAVVTLPRGTVEADLSTDRAPARAALGRITGHAPRNTSKYNISIAEAFAVGSVPAGKLGAAASDGGNNFTSQMIDEMINRECNGETASVCGPALLQDARQYARDLEQASRDTVRGLNTLISGLGAIDGTKTVVFLSESLVQTPDVLREMPELGKTADLARVRLYVIQVNAPGFDVNRRSQPADEQGDIGRRLGGLEDIAGVTGGELFRPSAGVDRVMATIDAATSAYYLVGFEPTDKERDGKYHRIEVRAARKNVRIKARSGFQVDVRTASTRTAADATPLATLLRDTLRSDRDLPLRATALPFRDAASPNVKVVVLADGLGATLTSAAFALINERGGQGAEWVADAQELARSPLLSAGAVQPGRYRLRLAAMDALGRRGVVDVLVNAELTPAGPLLASALLAGRSGPSGFQPLLDFAGAASVTGHMELYNVPLLAGIPAATLELATTVDGPALASAPMTLITTPTPDRRIAQGAVTVPAEAPAGDLVLRAVVSLNGARVGTVIRTVRR